LGTAPTKKARKKPGPVPGLRRPVVTMRIPDDTYKNVVEEAERRRLTISAELQRRLIYYDVAMSQWGEASSWNEKAFDFYTNAAIDRLDRLTTSFIERIERILDEKLKAAAATAKSNKVGE
jgi:hypothetical protein